MRPAAILALALATCLFAATAWADEPAAQDEAMAPPPAAPGQETDGGDDGGWSRQDYLAWHKRLGLASAVVLTAQLAVGDALLKGLGDGEDVAGTRTAHRILGTSGFLLHAGSFGLDVAGEAKAKEGEPHHSGSVHRIAMIVSTLGIIATPILGIMLAKAKFDDRDTGVLAHRVTAIVTVSGMWTAVITDWMD